MDPPIFRDGKSLDLDTPNLLDVSVNFITKKMNFDQLPSMTRKKGKFLDSPSVYDSEMDSINQRNYYFAVSGIYDFQQK